MPINQEAVLVGAPYQTSTVGAVAYAATTATLPTDASTALTGFTHCGYISEDGITLSTEYGTESIKDWSLAKIRTILTEFTGTITFTFCQTSLEELQAIFGSDHITESSGKIAVAMGPHMAPARAYVFNMKDGDERLRIVVPNGQITLDGDISFTASAPINWSVSIDCGSDDSGENIYFYLG